MFGSTVTSAASVAVDVDPGRRRVEDRRALELPAAHRAGVEQARGLGQLHPVVHAQRGCGIRRLRHAATASRESRSSATTSVRYCSPCAFAVPTSEMCARSGARLEDVDARVDLGDGCLVVGGILLLDDPLHAAVGVADDAAVAGRVVDDRAQHGRGRAALAVGARSGAASVSPSSSGTSPLSTSTSPAKSGKLRRARSRRPGRCRGSRPGRRRRSRARCRRRRRRPGRARGARRRGRSAGAERARRVEHVPDERAAADAVQHLGERGLHPRALARGEDDHGELRFDAMVLRHAPPPGFEPGPNSSKGCRAAITPRRTAAPACRERPPVKSARPPRPVAEHAGPRAAAPSGPPAVAPR